MKLRIYRVITGGLLLLCMVMIFRFSAQPASESEQVSGGVAYRIVETWSHLTGTEYTQSEMEAYADRIDYPVRKLAHMTEYGILCLLACAFVHGYSGNWKVCGISAVAVVALYAATDEIHQLFVPGRAGRFPDVCIDTLGAVIWLLLLIALVMVMALRFEQISPKAAYLQIPYLIWLCFAAYLNIAIWLLNR